MGLRFVAWAVPTACAVVGVPSELANASANGGFESDVWHEIQLMLTRRTDLV